MAKNNKKNKTGILSLVLTILMLVAVIFAIYMLQNKDKNNEKTLSYTDLQKQLENENIEKIEMTTGSTSVKVTLKQEIDENKEIVKDGVKYDKEIINPASTSLA